MKKKYFINCLMVMCLNTVDCFSAQDINDPSGFSINLSRVDWNHIPSVNLAISFIKLDTMNPNTQVSIASNILSLSSLAHYHQEIAPIATELMENEQVSIKKRNELQKFISELNSLSLSGSKRKFKSEVESIIV